MDKDILSKVSAIALNNIFGYEPRFSHNIIGSLGSAEAVFELSAEEKLHLFGPYSRYCSMIDGKALDEAAAIYEKISSEGCTVCTVFDKEYPALLKECSDAPVVLYIRSGTDAGMIFGDLPAVAIVGTRDISSYGAEWCERIVLALSETPAKPLIVSGMAIGVDIVAHRAALKFGLPTVGVLPVGINEVYPRRHYGDASRIVESPGSGLVTDFPPGTSPAPYNFLRRNRIIAGLASATILVESKFHGGGTMTARLASGYGRDVHALQGRIDDIRSKGCNRLIAEKIAEPIGDLGELVLSLGLGMSKRRGREDVVDEVMSRYKGQMPADSLGNMCTIVEKIKDCRGIDLDELCGVTGFPYAVVSTLTGMLEADGFIVMDLLQRCRVNVK